MTAEDFRRIALSFPETTESAHMAHPDFRVRGKIFATLGYPGDDFAMVKLTPDQQQVFVKAEPAVFEPVKGGWGRGGATNVHLRAAKKAITRRALATAWCNVAPRRLSQQFESSR
jgi:hypothetical protein